jgi:SAM-dependent methyltransferase
VSSAKKVESALWQLYRRGNRPIPFAYKGNLPYDEAEFGRRMLARMLDEEDGAGSRVSAERCLQINWLTEKLNLKRDTTLFDVACGAGLYAVPIAETGVCVTGVDFSPVSIDYANSLAQQRGVQNRCNFVRQDIQTMDFSRKDFDAAMLLYGQLAVMPQADAQAVLGRIAVSLRVGARFCLEMLNPERVDKTNSTWWFTDETGLWGDAPFLHLGERLWDEEAQTSLERYHILHLESGEIDEILLGDRVYSAEMITQMLHIAGFSTVQIYPAWDNLQLDDAGEWIVYIATL